MGEGLGSKVAAHLLDIGAVHINTAQPFTLTSGWVSPVYIDCRKVISFLDQRRDITRMGCELLKQHCDLKKVDYIAGGETAGIPYAAWLSESLGKPMLYVRKKPKGFGRGAQIEGEMKEGSRVLFVEDLTTDGASKVVFVNALREAGGVVEDVFSVFFYGIFKETAQILSDAGIRLHYLATWKDVLAVARQRNILSEADFRDIEAFLEAPAEWSRDHGGLYERLQQKA